MNPRDAAAAAVFAVTFLLLATGRLGTRHVLRGPVALVGGVVTALLYRLGPASQDPRILMLLAGLMALAGTAQATGALGGLRRRMQDRSPPLLVAASILLVAITSALLLNDTAVVVLVPFLLPLLLARGIPGTVAVVALAVAANVGSLLTPFGNPQLAILARAAELDARDFLRVQGPIVALGLALLAGAAAWKVRRAVPSGPLPEPVTAQGRWAPAGGALLFVAWALIEPAQAGWAAVAGAALAWLLALVARAPHATATTVRAIDLNVMALFVGMYFLTAGLPHWMPDAWDPSRLSDATRAGLAVTGLSNLIGNVPAVLSLLRLDPAWTIAHAPFLASVSTLGGALFLTGSAASLIAADQAKRLGVEVGFLAFLRLAIPWTFPTLVVAAWWTW